MLYRTREGIELRILPRIRGTSTDFVILYDARFVLIGEGPDAGLLRLWDFVGDFLRHLHNFLPAGIVGAHLGREIVAQFAQLVA